MRPTNLLAFFFFLFQVANSTTSTSSCTTSTITAFETVSGPVVINTDPLHPFESPKLSAINGTAWEYWYFDSISTDGKSGATITFFRDPSLSFLDLGNLRVQIDAVWSNGARFSETTFVDDSRVTCCSNGATTGVWSSPSKGISFTFNISKNSKRVDITVSGPSTSGTWYIRSNTPPRYPHGDLFPSQGASVALAPQIYWNEPIPSGTTELFLKLNNTAFDITAGVGGHERNFAPFNWEVTTKNWEWMRFVAGPYTVVLWSLMSAIDGQHYISAVIFQNCKVIYTSAHSLSNESDSFAVLRHWQGAPKLQSIGDVRGWQLYLYQTVNGNTQGRLYGALEEHQNIMFQAPPGQPIVYNRLVGTVELSISSPGASRAHNSYAGVAIGETSVILPSSS